MMVGALSAGIFARQIYGVLSFTKRNEITLIIHFGLLIALAYVKIPEVMAVFLAYLIGLGFFAVRFTLKKIFYKVTGRTMPAPDEVSRPAPFVEKAEREEARFHLKGHPLAGPMTEALNHQAQLRDLSNRFDDPDMRDTVNHLAVQAGRLIQIVLKEPARLSPISRYFSYYLPSMVKLAEGYDLLENLPNPRPERIARTQEMLDRMKEISDNFHRLAHSHDISGHDIELRLLEQSIAEDMGHIERAEK